MVGGVVEKKAAEEEEDAGKLEDERNDGDGVKRREEAVLYLPPTHARCLAARRLFLSICAMDSDMWSGVSVGED